MKIEITTGTGLDKDQHPIRDLDRKLTDIEQFACELFGGVTAYRGVGGWIHPQHNILVHEDCVTFVVNTEEDIASRDAAYSLANYVKCRLNQTSVLLMFVPTKHEFV